MIIRISTINDIDLLVQLRIDYLLDQNSMESLGDIEALKGLLRAYFTSSFAKNEFVAIIAEDENTVYSTAFLSIADRPPRTSNEPSRIGTVYNVYTYPQFRKQGIATNVMKALLDETKNLDICAIDLYASNDGKPLYEKLGFNVPFHTYMKIKI